MRRLVLLSRRWRTSEEEDGGVEYIDGGRDEPRWLPTRLAGRELPGDALAKDMPGRGNDEVELLALDSYECLFGIYCVLSSYFCLE